jgi:hypothetical protein
MRMGITFTDRFDLTKSRLEVAMKAALFAAANVVRNEIKRGLRGGYTSGAFVTGNSLNKVVITEPVFTGWRGEISVASAQENPPYPLYWELGHYNIFTRKYERVEIWVPAFHRTQPQAIAAYARAFRAAVAGGAA